MQPIYFDERWVGPHGIGRFAAEIMQRLPGIVPLHVPVSKLSPLDPLALSWRLHNKRDGIFFSPGFNAPLYSPIPQVLTLHDLIHLEVPEESGPLIRAYYKVIVKPALRRAWRVLTVSEASRNKIVAWSGIDSQRIHVVGNGISSAFQPSGQHYPNNAASYFLHVGRRGSHKNIERLIQAFALCRKRSGSEIRLLFTLEPDQTTLASASRHGVDKAIDFLGNLTDEQLAFCYRGAIGLVYPSLAEGFGIPIVEAMACGTPVISSDIEAIRETAGSDNAWLCPPTDIDAIANAMQHLMSDESLRKRLREKGLAHSQQFSWDAVAKRTRHALQPAQCVPDA
jgi:glycosyltransferase involved in cell wall biosynthesis